MIFPITIGLDMPYIFSMLINISENLLPPDQREMSKIHSK
jgi:hypothetical protein